MFALWEVGRNFSNAFLVEFTGKVYVHENCCNHCLSHVLVSGPLFINL